MNRRIYQAVICSQVNGKRLSVNVMAVDCQHAGIAMQSDGHFYIQQRHPVLKVVRRDIYYPSFCHLTIFDAR